MIMLQNLKRKILQTCEAWGFNLTKFMSNRKELLMNIQKLHRKDGIKDADLTRNKLLNERSLRVYLNVETDSLYFNVNMKVKGMTRRGMLSIHFMIP